MPRVELVVSGLDKACPRQLLHETFGQFGEVQAIKGIAGTIVHVYYEDSQAADRAIAGLNGTILKGDQTKGLWDQSTITVKKSQYQEFLEKRRKDKESGVLDASKLLRRL